MAPGFAPPYKKNPAGAPGIQSRTYLLIAAVLMTLTLIDSERCVVTYTGVVRSSWSTLFAVSLLRVLLTSLQLSARRRQHLSLPRNPGTTSHVLIANRPCTICVSHYRQLGCRRKIEPQRVSVMCVLCLASSRTKISPKIGQ